MFDHVGLAVSDLTASERFYRTVLSVLGMEPTFVGRDMVGWADWWIGAADHEHPLTRGLHVGFRASTHEAVDAFWQAGIDAGYRDDGPPGPRPVYGSDYYGGFLSDPDGNSVEAVHCHRERCVPDGCVDHLWIRVRDLAQSRRFYLTVAPYAGLQLRSETPGNVQLEGEDFSFSLIDDQRPQTEHIHLAYSAPGTRACRPSTPPPSQLVMRTTASPVSGPSTTLVTTPHHSRSRRTQHRGGQPPHLTAVAFTGQRWGGHRPSVRCPAVNGTLQPSLSLGSAVALRW
jgi:catechol 2,3-dioxygenase-like lactoylglutathione lyase family enzyme